MTQRQLQLLLITLLVFPFFSVAFVGHTSRNRLTFQAKSNTQTVSTFVAASSPTALSVYTSPESDHHDDDILSPKRTINANHVEETNDEASLLLVSALAMAPIVAATVFAMTPLPAMAADSSGGDVIPSALWSYGHLLAILGMMGTVVAQKMIVEPGMSLEDEATVGMLNIAYGLALFLLLGSGYFRLVDFGKGATFYSQEITFWLKMAFTGVQGSLALFKSITLVKRGMNPSSSYQPMSDKLAARMQQILNAEITGLVSIPLVAAMMARGVGYFDGFPWQAGVALTVLATGGASFFYAKQALTWKD